MNPVDPDRGEKQTRASHRLGRERIRVYGGEKKIEYRVSIKIKFPTSGRGRAYRTRSRSRRGGRDRLPVTVYAHCIPVRFFFSPARRFSANDDNKRITCCRRRPSPLPGGFNYYHYYYACSGPPPGAGHRAVIVSRTYRII